MKPELLQILACPVCLHSLSLKRTKLNQQSNSLVCKKCHKEYAIEDGIAKLIATDETTSDEST